MRLDRTQFAELLGYSEHEVARLIAEGMPVKTSSAGQHSVEIETREAIRWMIERAGGSNSDFLPDETSGVSVPSGALERHSAPYHRRLSPVEARLDELLSEELDPSMEDAERLAGKGPDELAGLLRKDFGRRFARIMRKLRREFGLPEKGDA